jgi:hypothetical protein
MRADLQERGADEAMARFEKCLAPVRRMPQPGMAMVLLHASSSTRPSRSDATAELQPDDPLG